MHYKLNQRLISASGSKTPVGTIFYFDESHIGRYEGKKTWVTINFEKRISESVRVGDRTYLIAAFDPCPCPDAYKDFDAL